MRPATKFDSGDAPVQTNYSALQSHQHVLARLRGCDNVKSMQIVSVSSEPGYRRWKLRHCTRAGLLRQRSNTSSMFKWCKTSHLQFTEQMQQHVLDVISKAAWCLYPARGCLSRSCSVRQACNTEHSESSYVLTETVATAA